MSSININSSEDVQGALPAKIENKDAFYNRGCTNKNLFY